MNDKNQDLAFQSIVGDYFTFRCHKEIKCFTKCCRALNLILTPYDIIRLKHRLNLSSDTFLEDYTETRLDDRSRFPMVYLKMENDSDKKCPFVTSDGCTIYEDRPSACRIYPLGRAAMKPDGKKEVMERFFVVAEKHCLGFGEDKEWTLKEWLSNEGVDEYSDMNDQWMVLITSPKSLGPEDHVQKKIKMFNMASYNLDRFKDFLFKSGFFNRFEVDPDLIKKMESDDVALMKFALDWLWFSLFGEKTIRIKQ